MPLLLRHDENFKFAGLEVSLQFLYKSGFVRRSSVMLDQFSLSGCPFRLFNVLCRPGSSDWALLAITRTLDFLRDSLNFSSTPLNTGETLECTSYGTFSLIPAPSRSARGHIRPMEAAMNGSTMKLSIENSGRAIIARRLSPLYRRSQVT